MNATVSTRDCRNRLAAFTLLELIVVVTIIGFLMALSAGVYFRVVGTQQNAAASRNVNKIQNAVLQEYAVIKRQAVDEAKTLPPTDPLLNGAYVYISTQLVPPGSSSNLVAVLWVKFRLRQAFPMSFSEALDSSVFPSLYQTQLTNAGIAGSSSPVAAYESSACLYLALQRNVSGGIQFEELIKNASAPFGTASAFTDSYGNPLAFCRWPTGYQIMNPISTTRTDGTMTNPDGSTVLNTSLAISKYRDPEDNLGALVNPGAAGIQQAFYGTPYFGHALPTLATDAVPASFWLRPIVISPGPDGQTGLDPYTFATTSSAYAADNITINPTP